MRENENIALLRQMEAEESRARRRGALMAWLLVALALAVLATMLSTGARRLSDIREQTAREKVRLSQLQGERRVLEDSIQRLSPLVGNYQSLLIADTANLPVAAVPDLVPMIDRPRLPSAAGRVAESPADSTVVRMPAARVYLHVVTPDDRAHADAVGARLIEAGFHMLGVEYKRSAPRLRTTELRYYRKDDEPDAQRLLQTLRAAGEPNAVLLYLGLENNPRLRRRQYEIWFAAGAGQRVTGA